MKKLTLFLCNILLVLYFSLFLISCEKDNNKSMSYKSYGHWPEYQGRWASIRNAAGNVNSNMVFLNISIDEDALFSGTYQRYDFDYTWQMPTHMGTIPVSVYNPGGTESKVNGAIDFGNNMGKAFFEGLGETSFTLDPNSVYEIGISFSGGFQFSGSFVKNTSQTSAVTSGTK